ncbi:uncharacterized protein LOC118733981 isoform X1 [Rhagoletis pomonella]|uniref:uncharacterized protein LOC118733981 isoform X1 n=1 Tax=Rhagoletis pomonella TaxID=28610 RepID=UPI001785DC6C|nr:uncharacterized protein LOC118733981 isoform X1 [Rhagoletis pomonella]
MGKHKNATQISIFIEFMQRYPDIAKGFTKRDKPSLDALWEVLIESLNSAGPPQKDANGWKKVKVFSTKNWALKLQFLIYFQTWTEWKSDVKKKLAHNNSESRATGGGPFSKQQLSQAEEAIVRICAMTKSVVGVPGNDPGPPNKSDDETPSTSSKRQASPVASTPKRQRTESTGVRLKKFLDEDNERKLEITERLDKLVKVEKENASSLRRIYRAIEKGNDATANAVSELKNEYVRINSKVLRALQEKNEIKKQQLDLDLQKFDFEKNKK